jgi:DNA invertase Pin-like site-specific DNA recombinase
MARKSRKQLDAAPAEVCPTVKTYNVGAYVRLSAVDKKQKGDSIENQQAIIAAYCDERPELVIREIYIDNGLSGQSALRPAFQKMLSDMENGVIDCCISKDLSRYGRSAIDTGYYIEKFFPTRGIRCIAINDGYDSADGRSGGVTVSLKNLVNESYALEIGRKIHATKQMNIRNGCFVGSLPPYGYLKSDADRHKLIPDPIAAPIVARIFEMAANGEGVPAIRDWLNNSDTLPPKKHFRSIGVASEKQAAGHPHWNISVIYAILKNRVYTGDMVQGKGRTQSYNAKRVDKADWVVTENTHEGLVAREVFDEVQKLWGRQGERAKPNTADNVFLRKIFCGHCGFAMSRTRTSETTRKYHCDTRLRYGKDDCLPNSIGEAALKGIILENLRKKAAVCRKDSAIAQKTESAKEPSEIANVRAELSRATGFLKGLYESLVVGDITRGEYADMKRSYENRIADLTERERVLTETARERHLSQIAADRASGTLGAVNLISDLTTEIVDALIDKILVFEDKRIEIHFKFTDEISVERGAVNE